MKKERKYEQIDYRGNWNIGAFAVASDTFAILGQGFRGEALNKAREALDVPLITQSFLLDSLVGSMLLANSNGILLPEREVEQKEEEKLKAELKELNVDVKVEKVNLSEYYNALGNLALCLDNIIVFHSQIVEQNRDLVSLMEDTMDAEVVGYDFPIKVPGSALVGNKRGILAHPMIEDKTLEALGRKANVRIGKGSVNFGSPWVGNGLIANSHGFLAGRKTTGYEMAQIWRILYR